ncbi:MAG: 4Fe-4S dicluster domain-containing protein [Spirochaetes bacterium]|nr:MAG: 4Fe-4S dicluster domain-containing protein [Spirochaetota bacterium]
MTKTKCKVVVKSELCKGCSLCIEYCKRGALRTADQLNVQGYYFAEADPEHECNGCLVCTLVCPEIAIEVYGEE